MKSLCDALFPGIGEKAQSGARQVQFFMAQSAEPRLKLPVLEPVSIHAIPGPLSISEKPLKKGIKFATKLLLRRSTKAYNSPVYAISVTEDADRSRSTVARLKAAPAVQASWTIVGAATAPARVTVDALEAFG